MIEPEEIDAFAAQMGVHQANVERDYVFGWLLKAPRFVPGIRWRGRAS